jgi:hypothetical protein
MKQQDWGRRVAIGPFMIQATSITGAKRLYSMTVHSEEGLSDVGGARAAHRDCIINDVGATPGKVDAIDWPSVEASLDAYGYAVVPALLAPESCRALAALYDAPSLYRSRVVMSRHGFGRGEYQYFAYPLPKLIAALRSAFYPHLAPIANRWNQAMGIDVRYPRTHAAFIERCHAAGQVRPTALMLRYEQDDYNCLHQDLYGEHVFPLQVAVLLSQPGRDFTGGEFVITEQRPRMQSRAEVVALQQGDAVIFAVSHRPVQGTRGPYRVNLRHGVSRVRSGRRYTVGIIFHDAL